MKALILVAAVTIATAFIVFAPVAEAAYIPPDAPWTLKAFCIRGCPVPWPTL